MQCNFTTTISTAPLTPIEYRLIDKIGEGTFSDVIKSKNIKSGEEVAIKCIKDKVSPKKVSEDLIEFTQDSFPRTGRSTRSRSFATMTTSSS